MLVSTEVGAESEGDVGCASCTWRMTNVKENISSSSLLSFTRKFGGAVGFEVSGSCTRVSRGLEQKSQTGATCLDEFYRRCVAERFLDRYSSSRKCIGNNVHGSALSRICDDQGGYAH